MEKQGIITKAQALLRVAPDSLGMMTKAGRGARTAAALARTGPSIAARGWRAVRRCG
jgi:hypothetical protein